MDTLLEKEVGIGTSWPFEPLSEGECIVAEFLQKEYGFKLGDKFNVSLDFGDILRTIAANNYNPIARANGWKEFNLEKNLEGKTNLTCTIKHF